MAQGFNAWFARALLKLSTYELKLWLDGGDVLLCGTTAHLGVCPHSDVQGNPGSTVVESADLDSSLHENSNVKLPAIHDLSMDVVLNLVLMTLA